MPPEDLEKLVAEAGNSSHRAVVVIVDDDHFVRNSLAIVLKSKYELRVCADGIEGVRAVDENTDCVILDIIMPGHDGFWVCKHMRKRFSNIPIIFYSARHDTGSAEDVIAEYSAFGYVAKREPLSKLLSLVERAVKLSKRRRESMVSRGKLRAARDQIRGIYSDSSPPGAQLPRDPTVDTK